MAEPTQTSPAPETTELHVPETMHIETTPAAPAEPAEKPRSARESAMERIIERAEEQRQKEKETYREIARASGDDIPQEDGDEPSALAPAVEPEPAPLPVAAAQPALPQKRVVDLGQTKIEVTDAEYDQLARMGAFASMQQRQAPQQAQQPQAPVAPPEPPAATIDGDTARNIAKQILFGDEESGARALQDFASHIAGKLSTQAPAIPIEQISRRAAQDAYAQIQFENNLQTVGKEYPDVFADDNLALIAAKRVGELRQKYTVLQQPKSDLDLYREALKETNDRYVRPVAPQSGAESNQPPAQAAPNTSVSNDRLERKRAAPKTPAAANRTASMPEAPRAPSGSDIVAWMKKSRGQPYVQ